MSLRKYRSLGNSGLRVSPFCLGAMTFGEEWGWGATPEVSVKILDSYLDQGGNFIDTANGYTKGHSEMIIGDNIGRHSSKRDRAVIATKFFTNMYTGDPNGGGASRKTIIESCEQSLRRLQTDYIDLYWIHAWDRLTPIEETMRTLDVLVESGKVRYIGFSDTPAWKVSQAQTIATLRGWTPLIALQLEYSLVERTIEGELVPAALELGLGITPWSPLKAGLLSGKYSRDNAAQSTPGRGARVSNLFTEQTFRILDVLANVAREQNTTSARAALSWIQNRPGVVSTLIGARTMEQLNDNLGALDVELSVNQATALEEISRPKLNFPFDFMRSVATFGYNGATINGETFAVNQLAPKNDEERF